MLVFRFRANDYGVRLAWPRLAASAQHFGFVIIRFMVVGSLAAVLAFLSKRYFEKPFLRLKDRVKRSPRVSDGNAKLDDVRVSA